MLKRLLLVALATLALSLASFAQTLKSLAHQSPGGAGIGFLLTDGTVLFQGNNLSSWYLLTPDISGSYQNGTWKKVGNLPAGYNPDAFASAVLADGRVVIAGGEYLGSSFTLTNKCAIYDPKTATWTALAPPSTWQYIGDSPSSVMPNGNYVIGNKLTKQMASLNPKTLTWTMLSAAGKSDFNAEEGWTLMPDGTILTADVKNAPNSERYIPSQHKWITAGSTIVDLHSPSPFGCINYGPNGSLCYFPPGEIGPAILRPDGTVFATGSTPENSNTAHTAIYTPGTSVTDEGTWAVGPDFPVGDEAGDSFAALLPNGNVLVEGVSGTLYEFNGSTLVKGPFGFGSLFVLPTGEVIVGGSELYTTTGTYEAAWAPTITTAPSAVTRGSTYKISGTQFNGLSQAASFGDEFETSTNYPLVRITNIATGHVFYAKTHDHSTMAVATGSKIVSTNFDVSSKTETGASTLVVVTNGIPSLPVNVTVN
ncbi:MAG TPA: kelch repeat-containing protein [Candidatus Solibacter sp.]|nr:kelch repeat-containing protein [Candidatus Solibacter sp.]